MLLCNKGLYSQSYDFSSSHVWMWELDNKSHWALKNWCLRTVVLEKTLESPLDSKDTKPVNPKGNDPEYSLEGLMLKLKLQYFGHLMWRANSLEKTLMKGWRQEEKGMTEDEMVGWHHWLSAIWANSGRWWRTRKPGMLQSKRITKSQAWLSDWITATITIFKCTIR